MLKSYRKVGIAVLIAASVGIGQTGCVVYPYSTELGVSVGTDYYTPQYYDGYVVYYDDVGAPFYYLGSSVTYVPRSYWGYGRLREHYRHHRPHYHRWYDDRGRRLHGYRDSRDSRRDWDRGWERQRDDRRDDDPFRNYRGDDRRDRDRDRWDRHRGDRPRPPYTHVRPDPDTVVTVRRPAPDYPSDSSGYPRQRPGRESEYERKGYSAPQAEARPRPVYTPPPPRPAEPRPPEVRPSEPVRAPVYREPPARRNAGGVGIRNAGRSHDVDESR